MKINFENKDYNNTLVIKSEPCQIDSLVFGELAENEIPGIISPGFIRNVGNKNTDDEYIFTYKIDDLKLVNFDEIQNKTELYKLLKSLTERLETARSYMLSLSCLLNDYIFRDKKDNVYLIFLPIYKLNPQNDLNSVYKKFLSGEKIKKNDRDIIDFISDNGYSLKNIDMKLDEFFMDSERENKEEEKKKKKINFSKYLNFFKI
ncbi:MAG: DUF6382 domain-containing protein [Clostridia bacterium]|nr:DUF6382 domain-containing protein [Clostridia bacterium]